VVPIPYAMNYTSTVQARIPKLVACEQCTFEYVYIMERTGQGSGTSMLFLDNSGAQDRATTSAHDEVRMKLERSCDPVPCPSCGWYQQQMVTRARYLRYRWMTNTAVVSFIFSGFFLLFAVGFTGLQGHRASFLTLACVWAIFGAAASLTVLCPVLKWRWSRRYNPNNEDAETRKQLGQERALSKDDFLKLLHERQADEGAT
jgi:hypothetical protein